MNKQQETFKPYIPADKVVPEFTATSIILGVILAIIFGAANAYLGLRVGLTISASIPAAVISMGVIRIILKKDSILENNMVQTIGSAGESVAAGVIFTVPALFIWANEWGTASPSILEISLIALCGGFLGVLFMIPLRQALIVKEHGVLSYPEGTACAEVLLAGESEGSSAASVFAGLGFAAIYKFIADGLYIFPSEVSWDIPAYKGAAFGTSVLPALLGVGYICGVEVDALMFAGGVIAWLVLMPMLATFGADSIIFPGEVPLSMMAPDEIWSNYVRYIGAGAVATGGILSLIKSLPLIINTFKDAVKDFSLKGNSSTLRTEEDLDIRIVGGLIAIMILMIWLVPAVPVSFLGALMTVIFGFFFSTVAARIVGLIGSSNSPVSGMTIATLLFTTLIFKFTGLTGHQGMTASIAVGSIIAIVCAISGDTSQDLKTGFLVGATPKKQQIGELIGVVASAVAIGGVLYLLNAAWGFGSTQLPAPQASLMQLVVQGVMEANLPWTLVIIGVFLALALECCKLSVMPIAIGIYLPVQTTAAIMIGGLVRLIVEKWPKVNDKQKNGMINSALLYSSGMIAGEGLIGILLAVFAIIPIGAGTLGDAIDLSGVFNIGPIGSLVMCAILIATMLFYANKGKKDGIDDNPMEGEIQD